MAKVLINSNDGNRYPNVRDMRGVSNAETADTLGDALTLKGLVSIVTETGAAETVTPSAVLTMLSDTTLYIGPGVTLDLTGLASNGIVSSSTSNVRITGDGVIVCTSATVPSFTDVDGLMVDVRIEDASGNALAYVASSSWIRIPSLWRLRLTGTGACTIDARDSLGNVTTSIETFTATSATDQIEFPYAGDNAVEIRFTLTGTCRAEII